MKFETKVIHCGYETDPTTGAIVPPIYQTATYVQEAVEKHKGYTYTRESNPSWSILEKNIASLEEGKYGLVFASGMAATSCIINLLNPDDYIVACDELYGGTYRLFTQVYKNYGIKFTFVDATEPKNVASAINKNTKIIWIETPTNPLLKIIDISAIASIAKKNNILFVVDNTFATPYLQRPINLGADIVLHSSTKYLGGHNDIVGGIIVLNDEEIYNRLFFLRKSTGGVPSPFDCWLTFRGIKTLALRMDRHYYNAMEVAKYLEKQPKVDKVYYPGLTSHPQHNLAKKQMKNFGGMVSFKLKGDARYFVSLTKIFSLAESLGSVDSLIVHPVTMTHTSFTEEERERLGITDNLIRLSVGIEHIDDLLADLDNAFNKIK